MFLYPIQKLTPSQLYISEEKWKKVHIWFDGDARKIQPVSIKSLPF